MKLANFGNLRSHLIGRRWLRRSNLLSQQLLINQAIKSCPALVSGERVRIAAIGKGLEGYLVLPIALQDYVAVNIGDHTIHDLTGEPIRSQRQAQGHGKNAMSPDLDASRR
jgi:hypothetical protein